MAGEFVGLLRNLVTSLGDLNAELRGSGWSPQVRGGDYAARLLGGDRPCLAC